MDASQHEVFDPSQVNERANSAVERQPDLAPDGSVRVRYKMRCPKCRHSPVFRQDTLDAALAAIYKQGVTAKVVPYSV